MRRIAIPACCILLSACGGYFGADQEVPLPGERISVMLIDDDISADPRIAEINVSLPAPKVNPDWPQTGGTATHVMHHLALPDDIELAWRIDIGEGSSGSSRLLSQPVITTDRIFTVDADGEVRAFEKTNGSPLWSFEPETMDDSDRLRGGGLAFGDGRLFSTSTNGDVFGLDPDTGAEIWRQSLLAPIRGAPTFINGRLLVTMADNQLVSLDGASGAVLWRHAGLFEQAAILGGAAPASDGTIVIAPYSSGEVFALRLDSGATVWSDTVIRPRRTLAIAAITDINGSPVIDRDRTIVAGNGGEMASLDLRRGTRVWDADITSIETPWVAGDYVY
ncbi:MAG: PQQ-binding-like beta-propeller repeat protein, partial [Pseudomonadota bacterium]